MGGTRDVRCGTSASVFWAEIFLKTCTEIPRLSREDVSRVPHRGKQMAGGTGMPTSSICRWTSEDWSVPTRATITGMSRFRAVSCSSWPWSSARARCPAARAAAWRAACDSSREKRTTAATAFSVRSASCILQSGRARQTSYIEPKLKPTKYKSWQQVTDRQGTV